MTTTPTSNSGLGNSGLAATLEGRPPRFRFSLFHLFAATTLAAIALAGTFGPRWDADERWIIGAWFAGVLGMTAIARARGHRGIWNAIQGGGLLPAAVAFSVIALTERSRTFEREVTVTLFVTVSGGIAAVLAVLAFDSLRSIWRAGLVASLAAFLVRWRPPAWWTGIPIGIALAFAWLATSATWRPRVTIEFYGSPEAAPSLPVVTVKGDANDHSNDAVPDIALTTGGTLLAACGYGPGHDSTRKIVAGIHAGQTSQRLELWETTWPWPRHAGSRNLQRYPENCDFSPDGQRLAITHSDAIALWDTQTGEELQTIYPPAEPLAIPPTHTWLSSARYTSDGSALIGCGWHHPSNDGRLLIWDAKSLELQRELSFAGFRSLHLNHRGNRFARVGIPAARMPTDTLELVDSESHEILRRFYHVEPNERPLFSSDDKLLAQGHRLWDLEAGTERIFPGPIKQFAMGSRRVVVVARAPHGDGLRPWLKAARWLPIVRHWTPDPFVMRSQLLLYESNTGKLMVASPPLEMIETVTVSRNGRVVATATRKGQIRIWDVLE